MMKRNHFDLLNLKISKKLLFSFTYRITIFPIQYPQQYEIYNIYYI